MANDNEKPSGGYVKDFTGENGTKIRLTADNAPAADIIGDVSIKSLAEPEKRSFLKDVAKGFAGTLVTVAKTIWHVPAAQGYVATLIVRLGVPAGAVAIITALVDAALK